jgi:hypothetical protein
VTAPRIFVQWSRCSDAPAILRDSYTIGRSRIVFRTKVRGCSAGFIRQDFILIGNRDARWTSFPNTQQPRTIEAEFGDRVPIRRWHTLQVNDGSIFLAEIIRPDSRIDFADCGMPGPLEYGHPLLVAALANAPLLPAARNCFSSIRPKTSISFATRPVQPVWWPAPRPAPLSPWKYS